MLVTLYINNLPVVTLRKAKIVYVDIVKLWKALRIREYHVAIPANLELITQEADRTYAIGNYCTVNDTMDALLAVPKEAYENPDLGEVMKRGLVEVLDRYWSSQREFTPLY